MVRAGLFRAIPNPLDTDVTTCRQFRDLMFFLTPAVMCPSAKVKEGKDKDHAPSAEAVKNCASFLRAELTAANPERILALGAVPFRSLCGIFGVAAPRRVAKFRGKVWWVRIGKSEVPMAGKYFTGNDRHKGFAKVLEDIDHLLKLEPRTPDA